MSKGKATESILTSIDDLFDDKDVDEVEREAHLVSQEMSQQQLETAISSGSLCNDLVLGGGYFSGRCYAYAGPEHGGKSANIYMALAQALKYIPRQLKGYLIDSEGTFDPVWGGHIFGYDPNKLHEVFGKKDNDGSYLIRPQIRYYKPQFGEQALRFIIRRLNVMPDKVLTKDQWWYQWTPVDSKVAKKTGGKTIADIRELLTRKVNGKTVKLWDAALFKDTGTFCVPVPNNYAGPEGIIGMDSWSSLTPAQIAQDDSAAMASQARMFAKYVNDIKSLIASKGVILIGSKQIRLKVGGYGDPEYSPGGEAIKHIDDVRQRIGSLSNQQGKGAVLVEGDDEYRYFKIRNKKNKVAPPFKECNGRWWTQHAGESGYGIDPVYDTLEYLHMTGQYVTDKKGFNVALQEDSKLAKKLRDVRFSYDSFKKSILNGTIVDSEGKELKKFDLRSHCFKQIKKGLGLNLFLAGGDTVVESEDEDVEVYDDTEE